MILNYKLVYSLSNSCYTSYMGLEAKLSERDVITKFILPEIEQAGWNKQSQIREEVSFTDGRIFVKGKKTKRGKVKRADIILF